MTNQRTEVIVTYQNRRWPCLFGSHGYDEIFDFVIDGMPIDTGKKKHNGSKKVLIIADRDGRDYIETVDSIKKVLDDIVREHGKIEISYLGTRAEVAKELVREGNHGLYVDKLEAGK